MINLLDYTAGVLTTDLIQAAINHAAGMGETLEIPAGTYEVTSLSLPTGCDLYLEAGAELRAIPREEAWIVCPRMSLLHAENATNIKIWGKGTLNGSGWAFVDELGYRKNLPNIPGGVIAFHNVGNLEISGIKITETVGWTLHLDDCDQVLIDGVIIRNPTYNTRKNSDGIDLNGCRDVEIKNCDIETGDDGICLKNFDPKNPTAPRREMRNIHVHHCRVASTCNATKIGTETGGDVKNVLFEDILVDLHPLAKQGPGKPPHDMRSALSAIAAESNDCAHVENITFRRYRVVSVESPVFLFLQNRNRYGLEDFRGRLSEITVEDMMVEKAYRNSMILAQPGMKITGVTLKNLSVNTLEERYDPDPRLPTGSEYPDCYNFGRHPSHGIYARGAEITLENCSFRDGAETGRPALDIQ